MTIAVTNIQINRCFVGGELRKEAVSLQRELTHEFGVAPKIRWAGLGRFDVVLDGAVVFSKRVAGRMPEPGEVVRLAKTRR